MPPPPSAQPVTPEADVAPARSRAPAEQPITETVLALNGIHCTACAGIIEAALGQVEGVAAISVHAAARRATVRWDASRTGLDSILEALRRAGYEGAVDRAVGARGLRRAESRSMLWRLFVAGFCAMQVMMLATPAYVAGPEGMAPDQRQLLNWASWLLTLPVLVFSAGPFFHGALGALRAHRISMDVPVALGVAVMFAASSWVTFYPGGALGDEPYFDSLTMFLSFLLTGRWLEMRMRHRAGRALDESWGRQVDSARRVLPDGRVETVTLEAVQVGDRLRVTLGEAFPVDGVLLVGPTSVSEALLTGESLPVARTVGDEVLAGSLNLGAPVDLRAERVGADTRQERLAALTSQAAAAKPVGIGAADRWAGPFLWAVLGLSLAGGLAWWWIDPARAVWVAVAVLVVTCPCALSLAAPAALLAATGRLARYGVLLQRPAALERLAAVDRVLFDKTGTLTLEAPQWVGARAVQGNGELGALRLSDEGNPPPVALHEAAALARWSRHPVSQALVAAATAQPVAAGMADRAADGGWTDVVETPGEGLQARDPQGRLWRLGRRAFVAGDWRVVEREATGAAPSEAGIDPAHARSAVWWGPAGAPQWCFLFEEQPRADAQQTVHHLQTLGVQAAVLSGDQPERVAHLALRLGLPVLGSLARPEDKLAAMQALQAGGHRVAMVGDGVNDAPVVAQADVSFAMGQGAAVAQARADALLVHGSLATIPLAIELSRRTLRIVHQNLLWSAAYNAACIPLALAGWLPAWAAGIGMALSSLVVVLNSQRLSRASQSRADVARPR